MSPARSIERDEPPIAAAARVSWEPVCWRSFGIKFWNFSQSSGGTVQTAWGADTDTGILDEPLLELDLRWRYLKSRGLDYIEDKNEFELELAQMMARDGGKRILTIGVPTESILLSSDNIQDGNWSL